jgi:hypothetical protein
MKKVRFEIVVMVRGKLPEELFVEHVIRELPPDRRKVGAPHDREATRRRIEFYFPKGDE